MVNETQTNNPNLAVPSKPVRNDTAAVTPSALRKQPAAVSPGQRLRQLLGINAPFGHDGLPTVWG